jgi:hypothetical protein
MSAEFPPLTSESTDELVQRGNEARARLLKTVDALDRKRQQLVKPVVMVEKTLVAATRHPLPAIGLAVGGSLLIAGGLTVLAMRSARPRAVISIGRRPSFWRELALRAGVGLATLVLAESARVGIRALARPRPARAQRALP